MPPEEVEDENEDGWETDGGNGENPVEAVSFEGSGRDDWSANRSDADDGEMHATNPPRDAISGVSLEDDVERDPDEIDEDDDADKNRCAHERNRDLREEGGEDDECDEEDGEETNLPDISDPFMQEEEQGEARSVGDEVEDTDIVIAEGGHEIGREDIDERRLRKSEEEGEEAEEIGFREIEFFSVHSEVLFLEIKIDVLLFWYHLRQPGLYPFASADSLDAKQTLFVSLILLAGAQVGRWYSVEFLLPTNAHFPSGMVACCFVFTTDSDSFAVSPST